MTEADIKEYTLNDYSSYIKFRNKLQRIRFLMKEGRGHHKVCVIILGESEESRIGTEGRQGNSRALVMSSLMSAMVHRCSPNNNS